ncbi:MAG: hypothetical protein OEY85_02535 [Rhodospirillales bacterium]|nr:hypothetical protein [Rhodospirillales bacterium]
MIVERLTLTLLRMPLTVPYKLSLGAVEAFDTILIRADANGGKWGYGEATILTGYTSETIMDSWRISGDIGTAIIGMDSREAKRILADHHRTTPFTASAFASALEMMEDHPLLHVEKRTTVPLLAILNATDESGIETEIERALTAGYGTFKIKVGFDAGADLERVRFIQKTLKGRALIRLDGNQGYRRDDACRFASGLDANGIELLEQPCDADDWDAAVAVARVAAVPMMLDESIYGLEDIRRAADLGAARFVKLKLMKAGGLEQLADGLNLIRDLGMTPVLGNGVAADVGCWMEACIARKHIGNAGEMNGFLKPRTPLFSQPMAVANGCMVLEPGNAPELDEEVLASYTLDSLSFPGN